MRALIRRLTHTKWQWLLGPYILFMRHPSPQLSLPAPFFSNQNTHPGFRLDPVCRPSPGVRLASSSMIHEADGPSSVRPSPAAQPTLSSSPSWLSSSSLEERRYGDFAPKTSRIHKRVEKSNPIFTYPCVFKPTHCLYTIYILSFQLQLPLA